MIGLIKIEKDHIYNITATLATSYLNCFETFVVKTNMTLTIIKYFILQQERELLKKK